MAFSVLLGDHVWNVEARLLLPALAITVGSGAVLMGLELSKTLHWFVQGGIRCDWA